MCTRQESNFLYAFGYEEPDAVGIIDLKDGTPYLFIPDYNPNYEVWNGVRMTLGEIEQEYGVKAKYMSDLSSTIQELNPPVIFTAPPASQASAFAVSGENTADMPVLPTSSSHKNFKPTTKSSGKKRLEERIEEQIEKSRPRMPTGDVRDMLHAAGYTGAVNEDVLLNAFALARTAKVSDELQYIEIASKVSSAVHDSIMREIVGWKSGWKKRHKKHSSQIYEYTIASYFEGECFKCGLRHQAYIPIVGAGANAAILHWNSATAPVQTSKDLLLIDAGAMYKGYTTDITRTYPANGVFTQRQVPEE
jgi:Xaa-Pro aminopeptidase